MDINVLSREQLLDSYEEIINEFNKEFKFAVITNNKAKSDGSGILLVGMNPSERGETQRRMDFEYLNCRSPKEIEGEDSFWDPKHKMMGCYDNKCAYIDLFPLRDGKQVKFAQNNDSNNMMMGKLLSITQDYIEALHPKLIIFANTYDYYWGFTKKKDRSELKPGEGFWMGYKFERIKKKESPLNGKQNKDYWPLYRIVGIEPSGVNRWRKSTRLEGSYFLRYRQYLDQFRKPVPTNRELTESDIKDIVEWIDPIWAKELL